MDEHWLERATASRNQLTRLWTKFRDALKVQQQRDRWPSAFMDEDHAAFSAAEKAEAIKAVEEERQMVLEKMQRKKCAAAQPHPRSERLWYNL